MKYPALAVAVLLCACAPSLKDQQGAYNDAETALMTCQTRQLPTFTAKITCVNEGLITSFRAHKIPYMDVVESAAQRNILVAQQVDAGTLSSDEGGKRVLANVTQMQAQISARTSDDQRKQAAFAAALSQMGENARRQEEIRQSKSLSCTSHKFGDTVTTNCN